MLAVLLLCGLPVSCKRIHSTSVALCCWCHHDRPLDASSALSVTDASFTNGQRCLGNVAPHANTLLCTRWLLLLLFSGGYSTPYSAITISLVCQRRLQQIPNPTVSCRSLAATELASLVPTGVPDHKFPISKFKTLAKTACMLFEQLPICLYADTPHL